MMKHASVMRVESLDVYGAGRNAPWHRFQYLICRSVSRSGPSAAAVAAELAMTDGEQRELSMTLIFNVINIQRSAIVRQFMPAVTR